MRNSSTTSPLPRFSVLFALGVLGIPEGIAAQSDGCTTCAYPNENEEGPGPPECHPESQNKSYQTCTVVVGKPNCEMSSPKPDCVPTLALDGRAEDEGSGVAIAAVGGAEVSGWRQLVVPAPETPASVARQACTGAIVQRRYSPSDIAQIRDGLWRVTI